MKVLGSLIIVSAPSGTGKTSLVNALLKTVPTLQKSISTTTRPMREGEQDRQDYRFVSEEDFQEMLSNNIFLEHAEVFGNWYGTSQKWVVETINNGGDVILEIDYQGAQQICLQMPDAVSIFILPPSEQALSDRLKARNLDDAETIERRLQQAKNEVSHYNEYEYLIVNDDFDHTLKELTDIVHAARLRTSKQAAKREELIKQLCKKA